jgi:hypothetical protein
MEAGAGGGKGHGKVYDSDREAGLGREWGGGLHNRDRSRIETRKELNRVKGKQSDVTGNGQQPLNDAGQLGKCPQSSY